MLLGSPHPDPGALTQGRWGRGCAGLPLGLGHSCLHGRQAGEDDLGPWPGHPLAPARWTSSVSSWASVSIRQPPCRVSGKADGLQHS